RRLAQSLGVDGDVVDQGGGSFRVSGSGSLYVSGDLVQYVAAPSGTPTAGKLPADDDLVQTARSWLLNHNLAGADIGPGSVIGRREDLGRAVVVVKPVEPSPILSETPSASVTVTASGAVAEATIRWPAALKKATYGLRGPEDLWSDASNGRGYVDIDPSQLPPGNGQVKGTVTITGADLAYTTAGAAGTRRYLVPIVAFKGQARIEGASGPIPVTIYVQAVGAQAAPRG
ncbi:MAG: hypothetical protein IRY97_10755, partial [Thermomicrobiaceae bacterium]|nr:hypothetical protein [Thermomicrobiaceae bacterium]